MNDANGKNAIADLWDAINNLQGNPNMPDHFHNGFDASPINAANIVGNSYTLQQIKSGTFASGANSYVQNDKFVTANSIINVYAQATPIGGWTVSSAAGSFTITSTKTETAPIAFKYTITN